MNTSILNQPSRIDIFTSLKEQLNGELSNNFGEHVVTINNSFASGRISGMEVGTQKLFIDIDLYCHEDMSVPLSSTCLNPVHFLYAQKEQVVVSFEEDAIEYQLDEFQTAIINNKSNTFLKFKKGDHVKITVISVCLPLHSQDVAPVVINIHNLFTEDQGDTPYVYFGSYNLKIAEQISKLNDINEDGIVKKLFIEGMVQLILAMEIQHHQDDINRDPQMDGSLTKRELKIIREISKEIKENIEVSYSVNDLTLQTGIAAAKLQQGFKYLYGRTVTDYIKNIRLEASENLIKTSDLTISEIVYSIGFSSRSYFSKIFKEKYKCSPRDYQLHSRLSVASA